MIHVHCSEAAALMEFQLNAIEFKFVGVKLLNLAAYFLGMMVLREFYFAADAVPCR
ncbi:MAG: hypothetical protein GY914_01780 [Prochlorococcus sp.]|nr:hypothetical protein [Prochlorococcus sp.]